MASAPIEWDLATGAIREGAVDRPEDPGSNPCVSSGHVLSETAGARAPPGEPLNSLPQLCGNPGACIDGEDRVYIELLSLGGCLAFVR